MFWRSFRWGVTLILIAIMIFVAMRAQPIDRRDASGHPTGAPAPKKFNLK